MKPCDAVKTICCHEGICYGRVYWQGLSFENKKGCRRQKIEEIEICPHEERVARWWDDEQQRLEMEQADKGGQDKKTWIEELEAEPENPGTEG